VGNKSSKSPDPRESLRKYQDFPSPKIQFSSHEIRFSSTAFCFLQRLSAFFNGFPIFLNGFLIFFNGFSLSEKSEKIYLRRQVYKRSPLELRISRHSLPKLRNRHSLPKLHNCHLLLKLCNCYNAYISPNTLLWCTCVPNSAPNLKSKLKYNLLRIKSNCSHKQILKFDKCLTL
jgi:hypothetical protein